MIHVNNVSKQGFLIARELECFLSRYIPKESAPDFHKYCFFSEHRKYLDHFKQQTFSPKTAKPLGPVFNILQFDVNYQTNREDFSNETTPTHIAVLTKKFNCI